MHDGWKIKSVLIINYFLFAILLNSVGTIILQAISHYGVTESLAANLDAYKDITITLFSFIVGVFLPRLGYKKGMLLGLALIAVMCGLVPVVDQYWVVKLLLISSGLCFALIKISSYAIVGALAQDEHDHASFISFFEGTFMVGALCGLWLFGFFIHAPHLMWIDTFWVLALLAVFSFFLTLTLSPKITERSSTNMRPRMREEFLNMLQLLKSPTVLLFVVCIFMYVFIEQGIFTWLPTFNHLVLNIDEEMSIEMTSIFSASIAVGRVLAGLMLRKFHWFWLSVTLLFGAMLMVVFALPTSDNALGSTITRWSEVSLYAYMFPLIGCFIAPIYPIMCSTLISNLPRHSHSPMMGLILVFSATGGSLGSKLIGLTFGIAGGEQAISITLIPLTLLLLMLFPYRYLRSQENEDVSFQHS